MLCIAQVCVCAFELGGEPLAPPSSAASLACNASIIAPIIGSHYQQTKGSKFTGANCNNNSGSGGRNIAGVTSLSGQREKHEPNCEVAAPQATSSSGCRCRRRRRIELEQSPARKARASERASERLLIASPPPQRPIVFGSAPLLAKLANLVLASSGEQASGRIYASRQVALVYFRREYTRVQRGQTSARDQRELNCAIGDIELSPRLLLN